MNANRIAIQLRLDYKNLRRHLRLLTEHGFLQTVGGGYGQVYFLSPKLEEHWSAFLSIWRKVSKKEEAQAKEAPITVTVRDLFHK